MVDAGRTDGHRFDGVTADVTRECVVVLVVVVVVSYLTLYRVIYETRVLFLVLPLLHCVAAAAACTVPSALTETASNNSGRFEMPELFMAHSQRERERERERERRA